MYDVECPNCHKNVITFEVDGPTNVYYPHLCEECHEIYYILQRSWSDPTYDNLDVEVRTSKWIERTHKKIKPFPIGKCTFEDGRTALMYQKMVIPDNGHQMAEGVKDDMTDAERDIESKIKEVLTREFDKEMHRLTMEELEKDNTALAKTLGPSISDLLADLDDPNIKTVKKDEKN